MPTFEAELSDGRVVTVESDHEPTEKEILSAVGSQGAAPQENQAQDPTSAVGAGLRSAAEGVAPGAAAAAAFAPSAALGAPFAPETFGIAPLATGVVGSALAGGAVALGQRKLLEYLAPGFLQKLEQGQKEHPLASGVGRVASALPSFEFAPGQAIRGVAALPKIIKGTAEAAEKKAATSLAAQIGAQTGITAAQTGVLEHRLPTPTELLEAAATAATFGHPNFSFPIPKSLQRPYARQNQEAAALHGNVRSQQEPTGQLPAQEGGAGVQPRTEKLAKATQIPLSGAEPPPVAGQGIPRITGTDELGYTLHFQGKSESGFPTRADAEKAAQEIWDGVRPMAGDVSDDLAEKMEREAISEGERQGVPVKSVEKFGDEDANVPFSPFFMKATGTGVELKRSTFREWIQDLVSDGLNEDQIRLAVHSRIGEEKFHNDVMAVASDKEIAQYSQDLTAAEKAIERRIYGVRNLTDLQLGHEAIRRRLQQAHGMTPSEFAETVGKEHVTIRTLDALGRIIRRSREALGTKAAGRQGVLYKRALTNIEYAKAAVSSNQPGAARRKRETTPPELADLEGARPSGYAHPGTDEYYKLIDEMEKRGVSVDGSPLVLRDSPVIYEAAEEVLLNGYNHALTMAKVDFKDNPTGITPQGNQTEHLVWAIQALKGRDVRLGPLIPFPGWKSETQLRLDLPSAARRRRLTEEGDISDINYRYQNAPSPSQWGDAGTEASGVRSSYINSEKPLPMFDEFRETLSGLAAGSTKWTHIRSVLESLATMREKDWENPFFGGKPFASALRSYFDTVRGTEDSREALIQRKLDYEKEIVANIRAGKPDEFGGALNKTSIGIHERLVESLRDLLRNEGDVRSFPAAARRRKDEPGQGEMFGKQPLSAPRLIKASDPEARKIPEGTTLPQYNANQVAEMAQRVFQSEKPSFRSFYGWAKRNLGNVPTGPMFSVWLDTVNKNLQGKPGAELNKMVEQLGLQHRVYPFQKRVGTKPMEGTSTEFTPEQLKAAGPLPGVVYNRVDIPDSQAVPHDPRDLPPQMVTDIRKGVEEKWKKENLLQDERLIEAEKNKAVEQARKDFMKAFPPELRDAIIDRREAIKRGQKLRMKAISAIFQKLIEEGAPDTADLTRKEIALDDLDWSNPNAKEGVWRDIRGDEAKNVDKLNEIFKDEARRSSFDNVSHSKRVAVMLNKNDGSIAIVSAYPHGRSGTMVFDPSGATGIKGKPSVPIGSVLNRWRPIASMLLKEPVKDFYKKFENIEKFNDYIGKDAQETERSFSYDLVGEEPGEHWRNVPEWLRSDYESGQIAHSATDVQLDELKAMAAEAGVREQDVVSAEGQTTERFGTMVTEPGKGIEYERRGGQLTKDNPLSSREALELQDFILDEAPAIRSKEDLSKVIEELASRAQTGRLKPREWLAISALRKAASETYVRENAKVRALRSELRGRNLPADIPYISRETAYKIALDRFYDLTQSTETRADFLAGAMEQFSRPAAEARGQATGIPRAPSRSETGPVFQEPPELVERGGVQPVTGRGVVGEPQLPARSGKRELTMRSRRPPTSTNWQGPPLPTGEARTEPADPELLSPEGQELARKRAEAQFPYEPTEGEPPEFKLPTGKGEVVQYRSRPGFLMKRTGAEGGYTLGPLERRKLPGAAIRGAENVRQRWEEMREYGTKYTAQLTRSNTMRDINSTADGADRQVETYSNRASNDIRLASVKPSEQPRKATLKERLLGGVIHSPEAVKVRKAAKAVMAALQIATDEEWIRVYNERQALKAEFEPLFEEAERQHKKRPVIPEERKPKFKQPEWVEAKHFEKLIAQADKAIRESDDWMKAVNPIRRIQGRKWNRAARALKEEALYAQEHYNDPEMLATVSTYQSIMDAHLNNMNRSGFKIQGRDFYVPGRYDGEIWNDYRLTWGDMRILGRNYRMPKSFRNYYEAISSGPYIPANGDIADLAQHSLAAGGRVMMRDIWLRGLKEFTDPVSKQPVAIEPQWTRVSDSKVDPEKIQSLNPELQPVFEELNNLIATHDPDSRTGKEARKRLESFQKALAAGSHFEWQVPKGKLEYSLVHPSHSSKPIAVREGYKAAVESAMARSVIHDIPVLGDALRVSQMLKHGLILIMDTFHPGRLAQYGAALAGRNIWDIQKPGFHSGLHALMYNPESLEHAVKIGAVSKKSADWALEPVKLYDRGRILRMSRQKLLDYLVKNGLNATQTADTIYRNSIQRIPFIGERWNQMLSPANKWIFDRITPGLIAESAVKNLERINPKNRHLSLQQQAREVVRDMNVFYGNVGRNGIFKNPNTRDLAQIFLLAPLWQEGLIGKELRTLSRLTGVSYALGRRGLGADVYLGPLTRGVVRGLGAYFVLTQMANLISRGKWTWENEEPDHKMDAWLPIGPEGIWVSPMSVFGEVAHDLVRLAESKSKNWDAITQFGMNKLGPIGRLGVILGSGKTPAGEDISTTGGVLSRAASELAPAPISIGTFAKAAAPGLLGAPRPGQVGQRLLSSVGIKAQLPTRSESDIRKLSERFLEREGLKYEPLKFSPTDEASYAKLRAAVRNDDESGAAQLLTELRKHRTDAQILKAMREASQRPYTGSQANERMFLYSLSDRDLDLYYKANLERAELYQKFIEWFTRQPL